MKKITFKGIEYLYKIICEDDFCGYDYCYTEIYSSTEVITSTYRRYLLWGDLITKKIPKHLFNLNFSIEDSSISKKLLTQKFEDKVSILNRKQEIEKGDFFLK